MHGIARGFALDVFWEQGGGGGTGGGGVGPVTALPEVPAPSDSDIDVLNTGDDEGEGEEGEQEGEEDLEGEEGEREGEEEGEEKPQGKRRSEAPPREEEQPDIDEGDEKDDEEEEKRRPAAEEQDDKKVPSLRAIKEKYPDFFKNFPHVRNAIAEHQQYRNVFSSVDEAREAAEHQQNFLTLSEALIDRGDFGELYDELDKLGDKGVAQRLVKNILPAIFERNRDLYMDITETPIRMFLKAAYDRALAAGNKNLVNSAQYVWQFLTKKFEPPTAPDTGKDPRDEEFERRVKEHDTLKHNDARKNVNTGIIGQMQSLIENAIDPKQTLKETTRTALIKHLLGEIDNEIAGDEPHQQRVERLWAAARRSGYAQQHISRIINAYLERAKQVLPKHARKVREEHNIQVDDKDKNRNDGQRRQQEGRPPARPHAGGQPPRQRTLRETNPRNIDWNRSKDEDILGGKAFLRKR